MNVCLLQWFCVFKPELLIKMKNIINLLLFAVKKIIADP